MTLNHRIEAAIKRITEGRAPMRIPADETDPDLVLAAAQKRIAELEEQLRDGGTRIIPHDSEDCECCEVAYAERARIEELEAQVARHPEQLRRVAEATTIDDARRLEGLFSVPLTSAGFLEGVRRCVAMLRHGRTTTALDAIITEALK